jgi:hypothetical protein
VAGAGGGPAGVEECVEEHQDQDKDANIACVFPLSGDYILMEDMGD